MVWAAPGSFATTKGIGFLFFEVLRCFTSPAYLHLAYVLS